MSDKPCGLTFHEGMFAFYTTAGPLFSVGKLVCQQLAAQDMLTEKAYQRIAFPHPPEIEFEYLMSQMQANNFLRTMFEVDKHFVSLARQKGYGKVANLALHAKSKRARKRNRHRAYAALIER